ncbi:MAG: hypothetical protein AB7F19_02800 [Candidatus Babeliales bacterium]
MKKILVVIVALFSIAGTMQIQALGRMKRTEPTAKPTSAAKPVGAVPSKEATPPRTINASDKAAILQIAKTWTQENYEKKLMEYLATRYLKITDMSFVDEVRAVVQGGAKGKQPVEPDMPRALTASDKTAILQIAKTWTQENYMAKFQEYLNKHNLAWDDRFFATELRAAVGTGKQPGQAATQQVAMTDAEKAKIKAEVKKVHDIFVSMALKRANLDDALTFYDEVDKFIEDEEKTLDAAAFKLFADKPTKDPARVEELLEKMK